MVGWIEIIYEKNGWLDGQKKKMDSWMDKKYMKNIWMVGWIKKWKKKMDGWMDG